MRWSQLWNCNWDSQCLPCFKQHWPLKHLFCHELHVRPEILTQSFRSHKLRCVWGWRRGRSGGGKITISLPPADFLSLPVIHGAGGKLFFLPDPKQQVLCSSDQEYLDHCYCTGWLGWTLLCLWFGDWVKLPSSTSLLLLHWCLFSCCL